MRIIGTGSSHPKRTLTNDDLSLMMDTSDVWIRKRTGICTRQIITDEELDDLAAEAARKALNNASIAASELDYIICSNVVNEYVTPSIASIVEGKIGVLCPSWTSMRHAQDSSMPSTLPRHCSNRAVPTISW